MKKIFGLMMALAMVIVLSMPAHALLINRGTDTLGYQLIYDTDLKITWYDYTNTASTWQNQMNWADALTVDFGGTIYSDWRLPVSDTCSGYNCTGSEMGHLYYTDKAGPFHNLQRDSYWSGTEYAVDRSGAWYFSFGSGTFGNGYQDVMGKIGRYYALAVRPGDVSAVPEPATIFLLGSGLAGMAVLRKRLGSRQG